MRQAGIAGIFSLVLTFPLFSCGDGTTAPVLDRDVVAGTYALTTLTFDPQGSLPEADIRARLGTNVQMILAPTGTVQIVYQDPVTNLFTTIQGTYRTTAAGIRVDFPSNAGHGSLLLPRRLDLTFNQAAGTLSFDGDAPDGVDRARLQQLVPDLANEQLLNPTPGRLRVTFTRA